VVNLTGGYERLGSTGVLLVLGALLVVDLIGDKVPAVDSVLHGAGIAVAPVSGAIVFGAQASLLSDTHPWLAAGMGMVLAGSVHAGRSAVRPAITAGTGGVGNPVVSAIEDATSLMLAALAIVVPVLAFVALVAMVAASVVAVRRIRRRRTARRAEGAGGTGRDGPGGGQPPGAPGPKFSQ
jgi:hypothetical protein